VLLVYIVLWTNLVQGLSKAQSWDHSLRTVKQLKVVAWEPRAPRFWFKTFSHKSFSKIFDIFYRCPASHRGCGVKTAVGSENKQDTVGRHGKGKQDSKFFYKKKTISHNLIKNYLTPRGLAYWIMCDGSLQNDKKSIILHTQSFSEKENTILSNELNVKFNLNTKVIVHKAKYYVLKTAAVVLPDTVRTKDALLLNFLIEPYMLASMKYKLPKIS
jgi:hypothetical protein